MATLIFLGSAMATQTAVGPWNKVTTVTSGLNNPSGITRDSSGNLYIAETGNHLIKKIDTSNNVTTVAGSTPGYQEGTGTNARFNSPEGITFNDLLWVADTTNNRVRSVRLDNNQTSTLAIGFSKPSGITKKGNTIYIADTNNHCIKRIFANSNSPQIVAGISGSGGFNNGTGTSAQFQNPKGIAEDDAGNLYIADTNNNRIRKIDISNNVTTVAGSTQGYQEGMGTNAKFDQPQGITVDSLGNLYVSDTNNSRIRKITPSGAVSTIAGDGTSNHTDGFGIYSQFQNPKGIAVDSSKNLYITEQQGYVRKMHSDKINITNITLAIPSGLITLTGNTTYTEMFGVLGSEIDTNSKILTYNGATATFNGHITGTGSFTKNGGGTLTLTGINTYTGGTTISSGVLNGPVQSWGLGNIVNNASLVANQGSNATFNGNITGTGSFTKNGSGTLTLTGTNTYTGDTIIGGGTLIGGNRAFGDVTTSSNIFIGGNTLIFDGDGDSYKALRGSGSFQKTGSGIFELLNTTSDYTASTIVNGGTLRGEATVFGNTTGITVNTGATFNLHNSNSLAASFAKTISGVGSFLKTGQGEINVTPTTMTGFSGITTVNEGILRGNVSSFGTALSITTTNTGLLTLSQSTAGSFSKMITGTGKVGIDGIGEITLTNTSNDYSGGTDITANSKLKGTALSSGCPFGTGPIENNGTLTLDQTSAGTLAMGITGTGTLVKNGTGTLTLSGANTYTGPTTVSDGTIELNGSTEPLNLNLSVATSTYKVNTNSPVSINNISGVNGSKLDVGGNIVTLNMETATTFAGNIIDSTNSTGGIIKEGDGVLTLSGTNTYDGRTIINDGEIKLTGSSAPLSLTLGGNYRIDNTATLPVISDVTWKMRDNGGSLSTGTLINDNATAVQMPAQIIVENNGSVTIENNVNKGDYFALVQGLYTFAATPILTVDPSLTLGGQKRFRLTRSPGLLALTVVSDSSNASDTQNHVSIQKTAAAGDAAVANSKSGADMGGGVETSADNLNTVAIASSFAKTAQNFLTMLLETKEARSQSPYAAMHGKSMNANTTSEPLRFTSKDKTFALWLGGFAMRAQNKETDKQEASHDHQEGIMVGAAWKNHKAKRYIGLSLGASVGELEIDTDKKYNSYLKTGLFAGYFSQGFLKEANWDLYGSFAHTQEAAQRPVRPNENQEILAHRDSKANRYSVGTQVGYIFYLKDTKKRKWTLKPYLGGEYASFERQACEERDAGQYNIKRAKLSFNHINAIAGLSLRYTVERKYFTWGMTLDVGSSFAVKKAKIQEKLFIGNITEDKGGIATESQTLAKETITPTLSLTLAPKDGHWKVTVKASASFQKDRQSQSIFAKVAYTF